MHQNRHEVWIRFMCAAMHTIDQDLHKHKNAEVAGLMADYAMREYEKRVLPDGRLETILDTLEKE